MPHTIAAKGYIGNTDFEWYTHFLRRPEPPEEVNFWQPSAHGFAVLEPGAPFFFRLKSPHNAIAGFGFFSRYEPVPAWLAWESFGDLNGAASLAEMTARIEKYRAGRREDAGQSSAAHRLGDYPIGCIMISRPVFFEPSEWVRDDADWKPNIVAGKGIDLLHGEGQRILAECLARVHTPAEETEVLAVELARHGRPVLVEPRLGQGTFRIAVTRAYDGACAITGEHSLPALEAAHVRPWAAGGPHTVRNGLLLRADVHRLYHTGYVTVTPDHRFRVSPQLVDDFHNGREYERYQGRVIALPQRPEDRPDAELLEWHAAEVFRG